MNDKEKDGLQAANAAGREEAPVQADTVPQTETPDKTPTPKSFFIKKWTPLVLSVLLLASLVCNLVFTAQNRALRSEIDSLPTVQDEITLWQWVSEEYMNLVSDPEADNATIRNELLTAIIAEKTNELVEGLATDEERVVAIATWVAGHITNLPNDYYETGAYTNDPMGWYISRHGLCGARACIAKQMLELAGYTAHVYNMYDFPVACTGHSNVEVYYEGGWHFLDVTYAGYFKTSEGILSFEQVLADPQNALAHMVVIPDTIDWSVNEQGSTRVDNEERMHNTYTMESLQNCRSYGWVLWDNPITVYPAVAAADLPLRLGDEDGDYTALQGFTTGLSGYLAYTLGGISPNIHTEWEFTGCTPGETYAIEYHLYAAYSEEEYATCTAVATGAEILSGGVYTPSAALVAGTPETWRIEFVAEQEDCTVRITNNVPGGGSGTRTNAITLEQVSG